MSEQEYVDALFDDFTARVAEYRARKAELADTKQRCDFYGRIVQTYLDFFRAQGLPIPECDAEIRAVAPPGGAGSRQHE